MMNDKLKNFEITSKRKIWFLIPCAIVVLAGIMALIFGLVGVRPMNLGIDFTGGTLMSVEYGESMTDENYQDMREIVVSVLEEKGFTVSAPQKSGSTGLSVRYANEINEKSVSSNEIYDATMEAKAEIAEQMDARFAGMGWANSDSNRITFDTISASASLSVWLNALVCVAIAVVLILVYVAIRFKWNSGVAAVIALLHDVIMMIAFVTIFHWQINAPFIAALITIIGYSINNTIVVFDRVRENSKKQTLSDKTPYELADLSVKQTLTRSINTTVTTLLTIVMLFIFGVSAIREFTLPIIIGLFAGMYSSLFIAPSLWAVFQMKKLNKKKEGEYVKVEKQAEKQSV